MGTIKQYTVFDTHSGWAVRRADGCYAEFLDSSEAYEAAAHLNSGEGTEDEYDWSDNAVD